MGVLDNYTQTIISDNRHQFIDSNEDKDEIIIGGSCTNTFELPFLYSKYIKEGEVIYKQGLDVLLELPISLDMIEENERCSFSIVQVNLNPSQTSLFKNTILDAYCQIRLIDINDNVMFDEPHKLKVSKPLKENLIEEEEEDEE